MRVYIRASENSEPTGYDGWPKCYHVDDNCPIVTAAKANADYSDQESWLDRDKAKSLGWLPCPRCFGEG